MVDTGYRPDVSNATSRSAQGYLRPDRAVAKLGISPEEVSDIILTHLHWDHADGLPLFPNAHVWVQKSELEYYATTAWQENGNHDGVLPRNIPELVKLNTEGRVTLVEGDDCDNANCIEFFFLRDQLQRTFQRHCVGIIPFLDLE